MAIYASPFLPRFESDQSEGTGYEVTFDVDTVRCGWVKLSPVDRRPT
jgi:hypothetical protein